MRFRQRHPSASAEGDMTPMIDMTFQLIAFFMVLINFSESEKNERITLPSSELAKPSDKPFEMPLTLQLTREGTVLLAGRETRIAGLRVLLGSEKQIIKSRGGSPADATVIIRADARAKTGVVQEMIKACQDAGFDKFDFRAKQRDGPP